MIQDPDLPGNLAFPGKNVVAVKTRGLQEDLIEEDDLPFLVDDEKAVRDLLDYLEQDFGHRMFLSRWGSAYGITDGRALSIRMISLYTIGQEQSMKSVRIALFIALSACTTCGAAQLGAMWTPVVPEAREMWLRSEGTVDPGAWALVAGPSIVTDEITLDGADVAHPNQGGVPRYAAALLPPMDAGASHVITVRFHSAVPDGTPVLSIVPQEGLSTRVALLNLPLVPVRFFAGLLSLLLALQILALIMRQRTRESTFFAAALLLNAVSELVPSLFSSFLPMLAAARISQAAFLAAVLLSAGQSFPS